MSKSGTGLKLQTEDDVRVSCSYIRLPVELDLDLEVSYSNG